MFQCLRRFCGDAPWRDSTELFVIRKILFNLNKVYFLIFSCKIESEFVCLRVFIFIRGIVSFLMHASRILGFETNKKLLI